MTTLLEPQIIRAAGKPPPLTFEGDSPAPEVSEVDETEEETEES
jgi:hypothetical protein